MVAEIVFQVIDPPLGKGFSVEIFMVIASGISAAGQRSAAGIDAHFQSFGVDIIRNILDAVREFLAAGDQSAVRAPFLLRPSVINDDVLIPCFFQLGIRQIIGGFQKQFLVNLCAKGVPCVPPKRRGCQNHTFYFYSFLLKHASFSRGVSTVCRPSV